MKKINKSETLNQKTFSPEKPCRSETLFSINPNLPFSFDCWTAANGSTIFVDQNFKKGARKK